jgi:hypothetical protein
MAELTNVKGSCLCGAVTLTAAEIAPHFAACHCGMCRKWGGGPYLAVSCTGELQIDGEENVGVFDSSAWAERGFCTRCGTHLYYRLKQGQRYGIPVGLLDGDLGELAFSRQYFIDKKPDCYSFSEQTETLTEAQVFELFAGAAKSP